MHVLVNYNQIVNKTNDISSSLLDHVHLHHEFLSEFSVENNVIVAYFSNHDVVQFRLVKFSCSEAQLHR